jgi:O-antigen/teichoic acid export membrane protein
MPEGEPQGGSYGRGAAILSVGIGVTGLITYAYFALASHSLSESDYGGITLLWSAVFVTVSVLYRPVEQLLSRTIADRAARGATGTSHLRVAATIQLALGVLFAIAALALRGPLQDDLFGGSETLYWVLIVAVLAYAVSYFARGFLAGSHRFGLYGGLVFMEAVSRCLFALAVAIGVASGQSVVALGIAAAPIVSLAVVPWALGRRMANRPALSEAEAAEARLLDEAAAGEPGGEPEFTLSHGAGFAVAVLAIMLAEQTLLNAAVITSDLTAEDAVVAGFVFNVLLIARAPLQLFQAVQGSLLPHLAGLEARAGRAEAHRAVRITVLAIAGFALAVATGLLAVGPWAMDVLFDDAADYGRWGLALVALGMGFHLMAGTLNQAALARDDAGRAAVAWLLAAVAFVGWLVAPVIDDELLRAEVGYLGAAALLCTLLAFVYRRVE